LTPLRIDDWKKIRNFSKVEGFHSIRFADTATNLDSLKTKTNIIFPDESLFKYIKPEHISQDNYFITSLIKPKSVQKIELDSKTNDYLVPLHENCRVSF
jgi:hypothetical protein